MDIFDARVQELVAIAASVAANCEPCFKHHYDQARRLGVSEADMTAAVNMAELIKKAPARKMSELSNRLLGIEPSESLIAVISSNPE